MIEGPKRYSVPDSPHGVKVKAEIMQRVKGARAHLAGHEDVPEISARVGAARVAAAGRIEGAIVLGVAGVADVDPPFAREELAVAGVARRQHAVEHVDTAGDAL